ncbi:hypothetical protein EXIGLDRAFT_828184 [Exidia glandulosa HHB12029]|uniref:ferric-chelate reductase (NADPH) n=1 Tax=Exidia glandulosa HHB12029 TaxID=1314781 RepID=A0A165QZ73_EXIGL|nr:hypothetical protein EXIGLDRAFT_828184 [Exidia glandulosa HHB12029]
MSSQATPKGGAAPSAGKAPMDPAMAAARLQRIYLNHEVTKELWYGVVSAFIFVLTVVRIADLLITWYRKSKVADSLRAANEKVEAEAPAQGSQGRTSLRRIPQAIVAAFRIVAFRTTIPIGTQSVMALADVGVVVAYFVAVLTWEFTRTTFQGQDLNLRYWCDRAAHVGGAQINLIVALAGKNNIISFLTGISHEKLNVIHRAAARAIVILFWVHAMGRYANGLATFGGLETTWMKAGVMALVALSLSAIVSLRPIRNAAFEFFLISHIITIILFIAGGMVHRPEVKDYFWPGFLVWGLDRGLRFGRVFFFNMRWWRKDDKLTSGHVELIADNTIRLTVRRPMTWKAGQHAYIVMPSVSTFPFEAHPFTIASISAPVDGSASSGENDLVFLIRGMSGFTKRLRDHADSKGQGSVACLVDGPYGYPPDLTTFTHSVLVAGGSGITYTLPLLLDAVRNAKAGKSAVRRILFIWAIRNPTDLKWISAALVSAIAAAPEHLVIEPRIYVTRANGAFPSLTYSEDDLSISSGDEDEKKKGAETLLSVLRAEAGRPDIQKLLLSEIEAAHGGRVSVDVAGPGALAKSVRAALRSEACGPSAVLKGGATVSLHVETFGNTGA